MTATTLSRRDLNRQRTRVALCDAAKELLHTEGLGALSAERVADMAGVSRRTFFNYFSGIDSLLAAAAQQVADQVALTLGERPSQESLVDSLLAAIEQVFTVELLSASAQLWRAVEQSPGAGRFAKEATAFQTRELAREWNRRRGLESADPNPLHIAVALGAIHVAFEEAQRLWLSRCPAVIDAGSLAAFLGLVRESFDLVRPVVELQGLRGA